MSFSSLIVQREIATIRQVEEALARQVLYGGDLATNLLEIAPVDEAGLAKVVADSLGIPPAPTGVLPLPQGYVKDAISLDILQRRMILPLAIDEHKVTIAVSELLLRDDVAELSTTLRVKVEQRLALAFRIREALHIVYAVPLDRRTERMLAKLVGSAEGMPTSRPPQPEKGPPSSGRSSRPGFVPPFRLTASFGKTSDCPIPSEETPGPPPVAAATPAAVAPPPPIAPIAPKPEDATPFGPPVEIPGPRPKSQPPPSRVPTNAAFPAPPRDGSAPHIEQQLKVPAPRHTLEWTGGIPDDEAPTLSPPAPQTFVKPTSASTRPMRRRVGPLTFDVAKEELKEAHDRDALLDLFFEFARQFFDYSALFVAHGDVAEGRDAFGDGTSRERVVGIGVPLDLPSMLTVARDARAPTFVRSRAQGVDAVLLGDLGRKEGFDVLVLPIVVRTRAVALFYGDSGLAGLDREALKPVIDLAARIGALFERIIVRKKLAGYAPGDAEKRVGKVDPEKVPLPKKEVALDRNARVKALGAALLGPQKKKPSTDPETPRAKHHDIPPAAEDNEALALVMREESQPAEEPVLLTRKPSKPPVEILVRRPSGPPIPREEDDGSEPLLLTQQRATSSPDIDTTSLDADEEARLLAELESHERALEQEAAAEANEIEDPSGPWPLDAPSSLRVAVGPRHPPTRTSTAQLLPSVMVDMDSEYATLVERVLQDPDDDHSEGELLRQGQAAMSAIMTRFVGPLRMSRGEISEPLPRVSECGPILRLIARQRRVALPFVIPHITGDDSIKRFWATFLITELAYAEAVPSVIPRLYDSDPKTRMVARAACKALVETAHDPLLSELSRVLNDPQSSRSARIGVLEALGEMREPVSVPLLIHVLGDTDEEIAVVARRSLIAVTRQDFGRDVRKWLSWWGQSSNKNRVEWLIDALVDETPGIRRAAGDELKALTNETFGYYDDLPKRERERAQQRFRDWWASEGRAKFSRP